MDCSPLQLIVIAFTDETVPQDIADLLRASSANGVIRLIDGALLVKGDEGDIEVRSAPGLEIESGPLSGALIAAFFDDSGRSAAVLHQVASEGRASKAAFEFGIGIDDLAEIVDAIPRASSALALVVGHRWNAGFAESIAIDRGVILAQGSVVSRTLLELSVAGIESRARGNP
jgi:uncharacterized membrane protein